MIDIGQKCVGVVLEVVQQDFPQVPGPKEDEELKLAIVRLFTYGLKYDVNVL